MSDLDHLVSVQTLLRLSGVRATGFGRALIPVFTAGVFGAEFSRLYDGVDGLAADWVAGTPARIFGDAVLGQELVPDGVRVGRLTVGPVTIYDVIVVQTLASIVYRMRVSGQEVEITTDAAPTSSPDEVVTALKTEIDALAISGLTTTLEGVSGSKTLRLTFAAGTYGYASLKDSSGFDFGPHGRNQLALEARTADPGTSMSDQLTAIKLEKDDFFFVVNPYPGSGITTAIATWCAANKKRLIQADPTSAIATVADSIATDIAKTLKTASQRAAAILYHPEPVQAADAAWVGGSAPTEPGSSTWAYRTLAGADTVLLTPTQRTNILDKNANAYYEAGGFPLTFEGKLADGTYIDADITALALESRLQAAVAGLIKGAAPLKIEGNDRGIQQIYGAAKTVFDSMTGPGRAFSSYTLTMPKQANRSAADKAARRVSGFEYEAIYTGATHTVVMKGFITE
jgi:hypothetical protein